MPAMTLAGQEGPIPQHSVSHTRLACMLRYPARLARGTESRAQPGYLAPRLATLLSSCCCPPDKVCLPARSTSQGPRGTGGHF